MKCSNDRICGNRQRGAVLVVSLIFLAILTILGVATMSAAAMQNTMASNFQFQIDAMQKAEVAVQLGEEAVLDINDPASDSGFEVFDVAGNEYHRAGTIDPGERDWTAAGYSPRQTLDGETVTGEYVIEYAGIVPMGTGNSVAIGAGGTTSGNTGHIFLIGARSQSGKGATRTVQTTLVTLVQ